jgi:hypothetical protein
MEKVNLSAPIVDVKKTMLDTWVFYCTMKDPNTNALLTFSAYPKITGFLRQNGVLIDTLFINTGISLSNDNKMLVLRKDWISVSGDGTTNSNINTLALGQFELRLVLTDANNIDTTLGIFKVEVGDDIEEKTPSEYVFEFAIQNSRSISFNVIDVNQKLTDLDKLLADFSSLLASYTLLRNRIDLDSQTDFALLDRLGNALFKFDMDGAHLFKIMAYLNDGEYIWADKFKNIAMKLDAIGRLHTSAMVLNGDNGRTYFTDRNSNIGAFIDEFGALNLSKIKLWSDGGYIYVIDQNNNIAAKISPNGKANLRLEKLS